MSQDARLNAIRQRIDGLDQELLRLISERARCAQEIAALKQGEAAQVRFYRPEREAEVLRRVLAENPGPLDDEEMARLFREIMSACLALEDPLKVAYLGPEGTFTHAAALKHFGHAVDSVSLTSIAEVFREVAAASVQFGIVPIENSTEGVVNHTLDMFVHATCRICGEVELRIHHHLLTHAQGLTAVERVYSHQQSLAQCREWLDSNLAGVERVTVSSNAEAARRAAAESSAAAIAGEAAAELYGLPRLRSNIEDEPDNTTRFLVIGRQNVPASGRDKTSLLVSGPNRAGLLYELIGPFARGDISMTRLESRPSRRGVWEYFFFIDVEGHVSDPGVASALSELEQKATLLKVLGSYPRAVL